MLTSVGDFDVAVVEMRSAGDNGDPVGLGDDPRSARGPAGARHRRPRRPARPARRTRAAIDAGATAYVSKRSSPVIAAQRGRRRRRAGGVHRPRRRRPRPAAAELTRRQREILQLFADGLSTDDAALRLGLSAETIRTHAKASLARIGARDRAHAVAIAMRGSLIE